jgi:hypothetical protein
LATQNRACPWGLFPESGGLAKVFKEEFPKACIWRGCPEMEVRLEVEKN